MKLTPSITLVPMLHGRSAFAAHIRSLCADNRYDCMAVDISPVFEDDLGSAVDELPVISALTARDIASDVCFYLPIDPCDPAIEGVRQARQRHIPYRCIGPDTLQAPAPLPDLPDEHSIASIGFDIYTALCVQAVAAPKPNSELDADTILIARRLRELASAHKNILAIVHLTRYVRTVHHFGANTRDSGSGGGSHYDTARHFINPDHLYFALGELPSMTGKWERARQDIFAPAFDSLTELKNLFRETRDDWFDGKDPVKDLSPVRIQAALTFLRNLSVMSGRMLPSLFDIIEAAKGVGGNAFALRILKNARYYPYLPFELDAPLLDVSIETVRIPGDNAPRKGINVLRDTVLMWRTVSLRPDPTLRKQKDYRYKWNPHGMCSHFPEDRKIENFNAHVRTKTLKFLMEDFAKTEKFTSSVKDGIDIRETLRNWQTASIYVREIPPSRGRIDTVIIIFDDSHDDLYPNRATWYSEHKDESTLSFYGTDIFSDLIGPGIARCRYGGLALLFPPRPIPDAFRLTEDGSLPGLPQNANLCERLTFASLLFSTEKNVAYVSDKKPGVALRRTASKLGKHLVWIPLSSFSRETLYRLRRFHVLNGKDVRSWASRFIGEE